MSKLTGLFMVFVILVAAFTAIPELAEMLGNTTYSEGGIVGTIFDMGKWIIPLGAVLGFLIYGLKKLFGNS